jgi:hypothetical protein
MVPGAVVNYGRPSKRSVIVAALKAERRLHLRAG